MMRRPGSDLAEHKEEAASLCLVVALRAQAVMD
jgi:hypothetical protein